MCMSNLDPNEIDKFDQLASTWWDEKGPLKTLHDINPLRVEFIEQRCQLEDKELLDVGCGGGILSESLAMKGANVTAIDMSEQAIEIAKLHALDTGINIDYQKIEIETFAKKHKNKFDIITCMELLEHVPDPNAVVAHCQQMLKPGGHLFLSTLNRTMKAYVNAIIGAEYVLRMLPRGTHDYKKFIKPSELAAMLRSQKLSLEKLTGISYKIINKRYYFSNDTHINYLAHARKD